MKVKLLILAIILPVFTHASLQVFPTKIELGGRNKSATITLRNKGVDKTTYKASAVFYKQDADGRMKRVQDPGTKEWSLIKNLRISPRRIVLSPGQEQVVRMMVRRTSKLSSGEYRAHIRFEPIKKESQNDGERQNYVMMKIDAGIAISVPVIYTHGKPKGKIIIENSSISRMKGEKASYLFTELKREGNIFAFGTFKLFKREEKGDRQVFLINGASSYVPKRRFRFAMNDFNEERGTYILKFYKNETSKMAIAQDIFEWKK